MNKNGDKQGDVICSVLFFVFLIPLPLALIGHWLIAGLLMVGAAVFVATHPAFRKERPGFTDMLKHSNDRATMYMDARASEREAQPAGASDKVA
jgi:hypothetical protein